MCLNTLINYKKHQSKYHKKPFKIVYIQGVYFVGENNFDKISEVNYVIFRNSNETG